jgi:hypothetical protein
MAAAIGIAMSGRTPSRKAALPPIADQTTGAVYNIQWTRCFDRRSMPNVKITVGHGVTPKLGAAG